MSPSKGGILKTPGTITRRKSVTFNYRDSAAAQQEKNTEKKDEMITPKDKRTSILSRNFPGRFPSPYTPRTRQSTPQQQSTKPTHSQDDDTDLIPVSRSAMETIAAHVDLVLDNNTRLQQIITSGELQYDSFSQYQGHPDLETMKRELEREKSVLRSLFADFEQQQIAMETRERELNHQYMALTHQMEEQYALQSSTAKIVEDYQQTIQSLNKVIVEERESYATELKDWQTKCHGWEDKVHELQEQVDEAKDLLRQNRQEMETREFALAESQEKLRKTQRQLSQLRMETLESRVGPNVTMTKDTESGQRGWGGHRRTTSRRSVSATYSTTGGMDYGNPVEPVMEEKPEVKQDVLISFKGISLIGQGLTSDDEKPKVLSPKNTNIEEAEYIAKAPGKDAIARRAAAAKRLEERKRMKEMMGKENSYL